MIIEGRTPLIPPARFIVFVLFLLLVCIQILDVHSTLTASAAHYETNKSIIWLGSLIGFTAAVLTIKAASTLVLVILFRIWFLSNGTHDREFVFSLTLITVFYGFIVSNNYLS